MKHDRSIPHGPASYGIEANVGIDLQHADSGKELIVAPRTHPDAHDSPPSKAFPLFPIPSPIFEEKARVLRRLAFIGRRGLWAMYLDTSPPNAWHFYLPPQWASPGGVRADLSYPRVQVPGPQLRLAGTFQSAPLATPDDLVPLLSPIDGVHLVMHPAEGWLLVTAFITVGGQSFPVLVQQVIADPVDAQLETLSERLWAEPPKF